MRRPADALTFGVCIIAASASGHSGRFGPSFQLVSARLYS